MVALKDRSSSALSINETLDYFYYTSRIKSLLLYSVYCYLCMVCVHVCVFIMVHIYINQSSLLHWTVLSKTQRLYMQITLQSSVVTEI